MGDAAFTALFQLTICLQHILKIQHTLKKVQRGKHAFLMESFGGRSVNQHISHLSVSLGPTFRDTAVLGAGKALLRVCAAERIGSSSSGNYSV